MPLVPDQHLLHYRITEKIGEGGMGAVWRATDTTLDREVAIKVLPAEFARDAERLSRFEREARLLASLNHPHIATIHGFHSADDTHFLVMELVEGEDLEQRIARDPVPLERAVEIATQVAQALEAAHAQGIVHRDLKPANVKLAASGQAKVLDFGLAKALAPDTASGERPGGPSLSPTITSAGTVAGVILGTAAYMSPEQARGKPLDRRADLWAFGCLLYEMLTRKRCFGGETISDTLASLLKEEPDWSALPAGTPPSIRRLLRRCLAKDPRRRLSDAADARLELQEAFDVDEEAEAAAAAAVAAAAAAGEQAGHAGPSRSARLPWIVAAGATIAAVAAVAAWTLGARSATAAPRPPIALSIPLSGEVSLNEEQEALLDISRDGRVLVFSGFQDDTAGSSLYMRRLGEPGIVPLPDTDGALNPFLSPDGEWVGFFADGEIRKLQLGTGTAIRVCPVPGATRGATWGEDGTIVYPLHFQGGLMRVPATGGEPVVLTELDPARKERTHRWPHFIPGTDHVLFTVATLDSPEFYDDARIDAVDVTTGERTVVFEGASLARYVPTGHLLLARGGFLYAVPFDPDTLRVEGTPVPVLEGVRGAANSGVVYAAVSQGGILAYVPGRSQNPNKRLTWMYADGTSQPMAGAEPGGYIDVAISPDGGRVAASVAGDRSRDIWVYDLAAESRIRLTFEGENTNPVWSPDGKTLHFNSVRGGFGAAWMTRADGSGQPTLFHAIAGSTCGVLDISSDGKFALLEVYGKQKTDIYLKPLDPQAEATPFLDTAADERHARFSPDGRWVSYSSDETGDYEVFVRPFPEGSGRWQISNAGLDAYWAPDGRSLHYRANRAWWVVDVDPGGAAGAPFRTGTPRLVRRDLPRASLQWTFGLSRKGDAFLVAVSESDQVASPEIRVVVDWFGELERLGPLTPR